MSAAHASASSLICQTLDVSASAYYQRASGERSERAVEDERLLAVIEQTHAANYFAYGYRRVWKALLRAGEQSAATASSGSCGRTGSRAPSAVADPGARLPRTPRPCGRRIWSGATSPRQAPNELWVADFERHEALCDRVEVRYLRGLPVAAGG